MYWYLYVKIIHVTCATLSITGFLLRIPWRTAFRHLHVVRIMPHIIDTLLLASGVTLLL